MLPESRFFIDTVETGGARPPTSAAEVLAYLKTGCTRMDRGRTQLFVLSIK